MRLVTLAVAVGLLLAGCGAETNGDLTPADEPDEQSAEAEPDGRFSLNCDYLLGDFEETEQGFRFVAGGEDRRSPVSRR